MAQNEQKEIFQCTGDCLKCNRVQREYCASQRSYECLLAIQSLRTAMDDLADSVEKLKAEVTGIRETEAMVFDPNKHTAQEGDGAEE